MGAEGAKAWEKRGQREGTAVLYGREEINQKEERDGWQDNQVLRVLACLIGVKAQEAVV